MTKRERVLNAMNNKPVDRPPVGFWFHFPLDMDLEKDCVDAHLDYYKTCDTDFIKIMCFLQKNMVKTLTNLKVEGKTLIVLPEKNENVQKSARNIEGVKTSLVNTINVYDLLKYNKLVVTVDTVKSLEEVYA